jgi:hypothetical protein
MADEGFAGMGALIRALQQLPAELRQEAEGVVNATADLMAAEVRQTYEQHRHTGNLAAHVVVEKGTERAGGELRAQVRSTAKHAHLFERGTVQRFTAGKGANRGTMPATPVFVPAAVRSRRRMVDRLVGILRRAKVLGMDGIMEVRES